MPRGLAPIIIVPRLPPSAGSWWVGVPRDQWRGAYETHAPRLACTQVRATAQDAPVRRRKFDSGSMLIVRTRLDDGPEAA